MNKKRIYSFLFAILFCVGCCCMPASAKSLPYRWYKTSIPFNCYFSANQRAAVTRACGKWSDVRTTNGKQMLSLYVVQDSVTVDNVVKFESGLGFGRVAYCLPNPEKGELQAVTIKLESGKKWSVGKAKGCYDIQTIVQHELGHAIGIAHCHEASEGSGPCWSATCLKNVMYPIARTNYQNITLTDYDISSYRLIYQEW